MSGKFQKQFDDWLQRGSGLWGTFVAASNTINTRLFRVGPGGYRGTVAVGAEGSLVHAHSVNDLNGRYLSHPKRAFELVRQTRELQDLVEAQGGKFLLVISPNKLLVHPEWQRASFRSPRPQPRLIDQVKPLLMKHGVHHVIVSEHLTKAKASVPPRTRFYPRSGAHLNRLGQCLATQAILSKVSRHAQSSHYDLTCRVGDLPVPATDEDRDLARIANVFNAKWFIDRQPNVQPAVINVARFKNSLFVGTSNLFGIIGILRDLELLDARDFFFYAKTLYQCKPRESSSTQDCSRREIRKRVDYNPDILLNRDLVILEAPEARLHQLGSGFLKRILAALTDRNQPK